MRRFFLAPLVSIGVLAMVDSPATAQETVAASCSLPPTAFFAGQQDSRLAQTFSPSLSGSLTRAQFYVTKGGTPGNYVVQLMGLDGNVTPNNTVLASTTVLDSTLPDGNTTLDAIFGTPATVAAGESYGLVVTRPGSNIMQAGARSENDCAGVFYYSAPGTTTWFAEPHDLIFAAYVTPPGQAPPPAQPPLPSPGPSPPVIVLPSEPPICKGKQATIGGTNGADQITGTPGADVIVGLGGNDKLSGLAGNDVICGAKGNDTLKGGAGNDQLSGQKGNDKLYGQKGNDKLSGKAGNDTLKGGPGKDILKGGAGRDKQVQ